MIKGILFTVCFVKIILVVLSINSNQKIREIELFYQEELTRKYIAHSDDAGQMMSLPYVYKEVSKDSTKILLSKPSKSEYQIFERVKFQEYARYIRSLNSTPHNQTSINLRDFPNLLQNTVAEEGAKREIDHYYDILYKDGIPFYQKKYILKGVITDIEKSNDSLYLNMTPFAYSPTPDFDNCQCKSKTHKISRIPFYYTGSLSNWRCKFQNSVTNKDQVIGLATHE